MAMRIEAINAYRPKLALNPPAKLDQAGRPGNRPFCLRQNAGGNDQVGQVEGANSTW
jgi:hypothetical protein